MSNELTNNETNLNDINSNVELNNNQENNDNIAVIQDINKVIQIDNYPYGFRLKTDKTYSIEFNINKGFRSVETTRDPKSNKWNKPKKSTYSDLIYLINKDGFISYGYKSCNHSYEGVKPLCKFIYDNQKFLNLNNDMLDHIFLLLITHIKISFQWTNGNKTELLEVLKPALKDLYKFVKTKDLEILKDVFIDLDKIKEIENNATDENSIKFVSTGYTQLG
jgi:hypothetical protein